eukprot:5753104-Heterocapsa_arctica.AAC.1
MSICCAMRTSRSPLTTALMAVASLLSKDSHLGAMSTKSSGVEPLTPTSHSQAVQAAPRPLAVVACCMKLRRHSAN